MDLNALAKALFREELYHVQNHGGVVVYFLALVYMYLFSLSLSLSLSLSQTHT